ncbi:MAG: UDP-N-acetylmuramoyl-L-alanyl-D-glutamate--2,6-diaminopimelate ligase [Acidimicrobiia bacterium]
MPAPGSTMGVLADLVDGELSGSGQVRVADVSHDSREVRDGWLFVAVPGARFDGHDFLAAAIGNGAAGLCVSRTVSIPIPPGDMPVITVPDTRPVMPLLAAEVQGHPSRRTEVVGVTGTNGKTTIAFMIEAVAAAASQKCGLIGTIITRLGDRVIPNPRTTPEATSFQRLLRTMVDDGAEMIACEVSSHALALDRVGATRFAVGAFTNLSMDHLDFHQGMEGYFEAKALLLAMAERRVVWVDDPYGAILAARYPDALKVGWDAEVGASSIESDARGSRFRLRIGVASIDAAIHLAGRFNIANALVAAACCHLSGLSPEEIAAGLDRLASVPGRFEVVSGDHPVTVVVDYAHTPEGVKTVIDTSRSLTRGRVIAVLGAGGDRDRGKRPHMGIAASAADLLVLTSDNPRSEDPQLIIEQVLAGVDNPAVITVPDRREAIRGALAAASPGDIVLILGKGHESGQEIDGVIVPFDDRQVAIDELANLEIAGSQE